MQRLVIPGLGIAVVALATTAGLLVRVSGQRASARDGAIAEQEKVTQALIQSRKAATEAKQAHASAEATVRQLEEKLKAARREQEQALGLAADAAFFVGEIRHDQQRYDDSVAAFRECVALRQKLYETDSQSVKRARSLGDALDAVGTVLRAKSDDEGALAAFRQALQLRESTARDAPETILNAWLAEGYFQVGYQLRVDQKYEDALPWFEKAVQGADKALDTDAEDTVAQSILVASLSAKATVLTRLRKYRAAAESLDWAIDVTPGPQRLQLRMERARLLARLGDHEDAAQEAAQLTRDEAADGELYFGLALAYSICSEHVTRDQNLNPTQRQELHENYVAECIQLLGKSIRSGLFASIDDPELTSTVISMLNNEEDLKPVRSQSVYKQLITRIEAGEFTSDNGDDEEEPR